jgi:two-component system, cell cycle sensor histidine kinase and response regulator CckA
MTEHRKNILVVDDDAMVCQFVADSLGKCGYHVLMAKDGVEALRLVDSFHETMDAVLIDIVMPRLNGRDLARIIQSHHPRLKLILISGYPDDFLARHAVPTENVRYLKKPFTATLLLEMVRKELDG